MIDKVPPLPDILGDDSGERHNAEIPPTESRDPFPSKFGSLHKELLILPERILFPCFRAGEKKIP